ncbi:MAG TPA: hypothetical protein VHA37_06315 [Candidatus Saccharimonadales bacterium]|nr:hypothetical protein [Candidatus Saccharimonadales bacterium]
MFKRLLVALVAFSGAAALAGAQPSVHVTPPHLDGPRNLADQTATAVIGNYIQSWRSLDAALAGNRPDLLERDFIGDAKKQLTDTIQQQAKLGISTSYKDRSHDIQIVFYSPEGLSVELVDNVVYDVQVSSKGKTMAAQPVHARYVVVMTPTEVRWRVRVLQAEAE